MDISLEDINTLLPNITNEYQLSFVKEFINLSPQLKTGKGKGSLLDPEAIRDSWDQFLNSKIPQKDFAQQFGFGDTGPLIKRWQDIGIYDPVKHYNKLEELGAKGAPLKWVRDRVEKDGRLDEIDLVEEEKEIVQTGLDTKKYEERAGVH